MKKAQGISINVIIVAVIALIILVVLIAIFTGKIGLFSTTLSDCEAKKGDCMLREDCRDGAVLSSSQCSKDYGEDYICCIQYED